MTTAKKFLLATLIAVLAIGGWNMVSASATTQHCPDHNVSPNVKDQSGADDNGLVPVEGTVICIKAGPYATDKIVADGETSLKEYVKEAGITVGKKKNTPDVSYWVTYPGEKPHDECEDIEGDQPEGYDCDPEEPEIDCDDITTPDQVPEDCPQPEEPETEEPPVLIPPVMVENDVRAAQSAVAVAVAPTYNG